MTHYIDPSAVDWTDGLNPLTLPQFAADRSDANYTALQHPLSVALRNAAGYEIRLVTVPDGPNVAIDARAGFEGSFAVPHGSFLYAISASSAQAAGFRLQVLDMGTGAQLFSDRVSIQNATGGTTQGIRQPLLYLEKPKSFCHPGQGSVQIINSAPVPNDVQIVLWFAQPIQDERATSYQPNYWNGMLAAELAATLRAVRGTAGAAPGQAGGAAGGQAQTADHLTMPANGRVFHYQAAVDVPAPGTNDFQIISFRVPVGYTAAIGSIQNRYAGPGFIDGSRELIWRISVDGAYSPGFDELTTMLGADGSFHQLPGNILANSGQLVEYTVSVAADSALGGRIIAGFEGYFYPTN